MNPEEGARLTDCSVEVENNQDVASRLISLHSQAELFQLSEYNNALQKATSGRKFRILFSKSESLQAEITIDEMLQYQDGQLITPLLTTSAHLRSQALNMFALIQKFLNSEKLLSTSNQNLETIQYLLQMALKTKELRDEVYMQIFKQSRKNDNPDLQLRVWALFHIVASTMPPSKQFVSLLSHYIHEVCHDETIRLDLKRRVSGTWKALKRTVKDGPRLTLPSLHEIHVLLSDKRLKIWVYFLDGTYEELSYTVSTTVGDAVEQIAQSIELDNFQTFSLFESQEHAKDHTLLEDNRYIADILAKGSSASGDLGVQKLIFKKKMFRESDEFITEAQFLNLSFVQAQYDYLLGHYPVVYEDATQLCALQLFSEFGPEIPGESKRLMKAIERYTCKDIRIAKSREDWKDDVLLKCSKLKCPSSEAARYSFLTLLRSLPYGSSVFFNVNRLGDPIGLLPPKLILGINRRGIHFIRPVPKEYLHSVELKDIMQFGSSDNAVFLKMKVTSVLDVFKFETHHGEDICMTLQTHINDIMVKKYVHTLSNQKMKSKDSSTLPVADFGADYKEHLTAKQKAIEDATKKCEELSQLQGELLYERDCSLIHLKEIKQNVTALKTDNESRKKVILESERESSSLKSTLESLQLDLATCQAMQEEGENRIIEFNALVEATNTKTDELLKGREMVRLQTHRLSELEKDKMLIEENIRKVEEERKVESCELKAALKEVHMHEMHECSLRENEIASLVERIGNITAMYHEDKREIQSIQKDQEDLVFLKQIKAKIEQEDEEQASKIKDQTSKIFSAECMYKSERVTRRKIYNKIEDLKGRIRVFARIRPLIDHEKKEGQRSVLSYPDELTISHFWRRDGCAREYSFDRVFGPGATQLEVFKDTDDLLQSAIDGYNICVFAYGQTGSGKTYTIHGDDEHPGLAPQGIDKLFQILHKGSNKFGSSVCCYMLEIYQDTLLDLLAQKNARFIGLPRLSSVSRLSDGRKLSESSSLCGKGKLDIKKESNSHMVYVQGLTVVDVHSAEELKALFEEGQKHRHVASTDLNIESSRSHLIMGLIVETTDLQTQVHTRGKISFVDLAGSERVKKSHSVGEQLNEARAINKSLSALGDVISALERGDPHIPYRNHKLTMLMSDSLGGNAKTLMFVNVSPTDSNLDETQNSLQYAMRVRSIRNEVCKNSNRETADLKRQISAWKAMQGSDKKNQVHRMIKEFL